MEKEITWKTGDGRQVVFVVELQTKRLLGRDDIAGEITKPCCEINYSATVAGKDVGGTGWLRTITPQQAGSVTLVAALGKLGISEDNYKRITDAVSEIKESDYWTKWHRKVAEGERTDREYREHVTRVKKMMDE